MDNTPLANIRIAAPCNAEWKWMYGNDRVRFCGQCSQNVFNLSTMTTEEAEDLIRRTEGTLCVRFYRRRDGSILTRNCSVGIQAIKDKFTRTRTHIIAAMLSFLGYLGVIGLSSRAVVMGDIADSTVQYPIATGPLPMKPDRILVSQSEAVIRQRAIFKVIPVYHSAGKNLSQEVATVRVTIAEDGTVDSAVCANGNSPVRALAEEAAREWKFEPILVDGKPARVVSVLTFRFGKD